MLKIRVKVKPGSSRNELTIIQPDNWQIRLRAKPIDGEANQALIAFLSEELDISKSKIHIEKGLTSQYKTLLIDTDKLIFKENLKGF